MRHITFLNVMMPTDGTVSFGLDPDTVEYLWYNTLSRGDLDQYEVIIELAPHGCDVTVRPWSESGVLTSGPSWLSYLIGGCFIASLLFMLWSKYYA